MKLAIGEWNVATNLGIIVYFLLHCIIINFLKWKPTWTVSRLIFFHVGLQIQQLAIVLLWFRSAQSTTTAYSSWTRTNTLSIADPSLQVLPSSNLTPEINDKYDCLLAAVLWQLS